MTELQKGDRTHVEEGMPKRGRFLLIVLKQEVATKAICRTQRLCAQYCG
jgi:hypothetical protein